MINTHRIISGHDVELMLGKGWFLTALRALNDRGLLLSDGPPPPFPPDTQITVDDVNIIFPADDRDLELSLTIGNVPITVFLTLELSDDGSELIISNNIPNVGPTTVPFGVLSGLAEPPKLVKLHGDDNNDPAIAFLVNLDLRVSPQSGEPLPPDQHVERGTQLAVSFLPPGKDMVIGLGIDTFPRLANDIWHTKLREDDGSHPFPNADDIQGSWKSVEVKPESGKIHMVLKAEVPVDSPIIDVVPDAKITITIDLTPGTNNGNVNFSMKVDTDVDTGLLGDLFAFITGGLLGFLLGLAFGGALIGAGIGAFAGVIILEIAECVKNGEVRQKVLSSLEGEPIPPTLACQDDVVVEAQVPQDSSLVDAFVSAVPQSIPIGTDKPEPIYERTVLVMNVFDEFQMDDHGMAFAAMVQPTERFQPLPAKLIDKQREEDQLKTLIYEAEDGTVQELTLEDVLQRMQEAELKPPLHVLPLPDDAEVRRPEGRLPSLCMSATAIKRKNTIVRNIQFSTGLELKVPEAVALQDAGAIVLRGLQLIHPKNAHPYFRAFADKTTENNFESLPKFEPTES